MGRQGRCQPCCDTPTSGLNFRQPPAKRVGGTERVGRPVVGTGRACALPPGPPIGATPSTHKKAAKRGAAVRQHFRAAKPARCLSGSDRRRIGRDVGDGQGQRATHGGGLVAQRHDQIDSSLSHDGLDPQEAGESAERRHPLACLPMLVVRSAACAYCLTLIRRLSRERRSSSSAT